MTFSIIVPIYNVEKYLVACLDSILRQTFKDYELILINDGSTDESLKICRTYLNKDKRIKLIDKSNGGLSSARNAGISKAEGDFILFIDSDDLYLNSFGLENIKNAIDIYGNCVVCWKFKKDTFETISYSDKSNTLYKLLDDDFKKMHSIKKANIVASACLYCVPRQLFNEKLMFKEDETSEDIEWFFELLRTGVRFVFYNDVLYGYRKRPESISNSISEKNVLCLEKHLNYMIDYLQSINFKNKLLTLYFGEQVANYFIVLSRTATKENNAKIYKKYLKYAKRKRSVLIRIYSNIFGVENTIKSLRRLK